MIRAIAFWLYRIASILLACGLAVLFCYEWGQSFQDANGQPLGDLMLALNALVIYSLCLFLFLRELPQAPQGPEVWEPIVWGVVLVVLVPVVWGFQFPDCAVPVGHAAWFIFVVNLVPVGMLGRKTRPLLVAAWLGSLRGIGAVRRGFCDGCATFVFDLLSPSPGAGHGRMSPSKTRKTPK